MPQSNKKTQTPQTGKTPAGTRPDTTIVLTISGNPRPGPDGKSLRAVTVAARRGDTAYLKQIETADLVDDLRAVLRDVSAHFFQSEMQPAAEWPVAAPTTRPVPTAPPSAVQTLPASGNEEADNAAPENPLESGVPDEPDEAAFADEETVVDAGLNGPQAQESLTDDEYYAAQADAYEGIDAAEEDYRITFYTPETAAAPAGNAQQPSL
jgi:hypothetical protein